MTILRKNGLIAGLAKIDFFQERHLLSSSIDKRVYSSIYGSSTAYAKYEHFTKISRPQHAHVLGPSNTPCHGSKFPGPKLRAYS